MTRPTVPDVLPLVRRLYERHSAGCCWHVVLDDGNVGDGIVAETAADARAHPCGAAECLELATLLPQMSTTQRRKLRALAHG